MLRESGGRSSSGMCQPGSMEMLRACASWASPPAQTADEGAELCPRIQPLLHLTPFSGIPY